MQRYLLFDAGCLVCGSVAQAIETAAEGWLVARSLSDQKVQRQLTQAKPNWKWEPTLLEVEQDRITASTGLKLRLKLLWGLGPQRTWQTVQLMRQVLAPKDILNPQRRRFFAKSSAILGGILLGVGAGSLTPSLATLAHAQSAPPQRLSTSHLSPDAARHQLANSQTFREASQRLGSPDWEQVYSYQHLDGRSKGLVIFYPPSAHRGSGTTFLAIDDPMAKTTNVALVGYLTNKGSQHAELAWETATGIPLATQVFQDGHTTTFPAPQPSLEIQPNFNIPCFFQCLGKTVTVACAIDCFICAPDPFFNIPQCVACGICAGSSGIACALDCNF